VIQHLFQVISLDLANILVQGPSIQPTSTILEANPTFKQPPSLKIVINTIFKDALQGLLSSNRNAIDQNVMQALFSSSRGCINQPYNLGPKQKRGHT
jgi:hypothetical protein